jgi:hypothetical protein
VKVQLPDVRAVASHRDAPGVVILGGHRTRGVEGTACERLRLTARLRQLILRITLRITLKITLRLRHGWLLMRGRRVAMDVMVILGGHRTRGVEGTAREGVRLTARLRERTHSGIAVQKGGRG